MILIDKAKLMNHIENESRKWGEDYDSYQILGDIEDFDTVEAIPIEWIINHKKYPTNKEKAKVIEDMIYDWRKENE